MRQINDEELGVVHSASLRLMSEQPMTDADMRTVGHALFHVRECVLIRPEPGPAPVRRIELGVILDPRSKAADHVLSGDTAAFTFVPPTGPSQFSFGKIHRVNGRGDLGEPILDVVPTGAASTDAGLGATVAALLSGLVMVIQNGRGRAET